MIAIASIWMFIYMAKNGLFDQMLVSLGLEPMNVLSNKSTVLPAMAVMYVWKEAGYLMVFFLSGIQSISDEVNEAARIDGADSWTIFRKITLPLLAPTFLFVSTIALTNSFKLVDHVVIMTEGAPNNASTLLLYYIYQQGFTNFNYGVSSALTTVMLVLLMIVALPRFLSQDKKIHYNWSRNYTLCGYSGDNLVDSADLADRDCVFCPLLPYDPVSDYAFYTGQLKVCVECDSLRDLLPEYADSGDLYLCSAVRHFHSGGICVGRYGF